MAFVAVGAPRRGRSRGSINPAMRGLIEALPTPRPIGELPSCPSGRRVLPADDGAFDEVVAPLFTTIDCWDSYLDPELAPDDFVDWLASWVGVDIDETWTLERRRRLIQDAVALYRIRGTAAGLAAHVNLYAGVTPEIEENGGCEWSQTAGSPLPGSPPSRPPGAPASRRRRQCEAHHPQSHHRGLASRPHALPGRYSSVERRCRRPRTPRRRRPPTQRVRRRGPTGLRARRARPAGTRQRRGSSKGRLRSCRRGRAQPVTDHAAPASSHRPRLSGKPRPTTSRPALGHERGSQLAGVEKKAAQARLAPVRSPPLRQKTLAGQSLNPKLAQLKQAKNLAKSSVTGELGQANKGGAACRNSWRAAIRPPSRAWQPRGSEQA